MRFCFSVAVFLVSLISFGQTSSSSIVLNHPKKLHRIIAMRHGERYDSIFYQFLKDKTLEEARALLEKEGADKGFAIHDPPLADAIYQNHLPDALARLKKTPFGITLIISSPYRRSIETAIAVRNEVAPTTSIIIDRRLGEWPAASFGRFNEPVQAVEPSIQALFIELSETMISQEILEQENEFTTESRSAHQARIKAVLLEYAQRQDGILVVGHYDTVYALQAGDPLEVAEFRCGVYQNSILTPTPCDSSLNESVYSKPVSY